jgi:(1->4)-alpha-D-glucan 1-alpha-D-glucosylmutase
VHGRWNSLAQTILKVASPGVCDFYQGTELWSLTLVDPDNRRNVDFESCIAQIAKLRTIPEPTPNLAAMLIDANDSALKLFATQRGLSARHADAGLFTAGEYVPLAVHGKHAKRVVALARRLGTRIAVAVAPRLTVGLTGFGGPPPLGDLWGDTAVHLPADLLAATVANPLTDVLSRTSHVPAAVMRVADLLRAFPAALCIST